MIFLIKAALEESFSSRNDEKWTAVLLLLGNHHWGEILLDETN